MPIDSQHPEYTKYKLIWQKCIDFYEGEEAVKEHRTDYIPVLAGQSSVKYDAYVNRGIFYNAAGRTVAGLVGAIFRKEAFIQLPDGLSYLYDDATNTGVSIYQLLVHTLTEQMVTSRSGILVDRPKDGGRPYLTYYDALAIRNWNIGVPFVTLAETYWDFEQDAYAPEEKTRFRELRLDSSGNYYQNVWVDLDGYIPDQPAYLVNRGRPISYIPFVCITPSGMDFDVIRPTILDLVNVQHKHYMLSCDYANGLHVVGLPTPYITGIKKTDDLVLNLGTDTTLAIPNPASKVGFLEFQGQGLDPMEKALTKLENMLAALGARLVETSKNQMKSETAEGVRTREAAATAVLSSIIYAVEKGFTKALRWMAEWEGYDPNEVQIKINRELVESRIDSNTMNALLNLLQQQAISYETFYHNLEEAGFTLPGVDYKKEIQNILSNEFAVIGTEKSVPTVKEEILVEKDVENVPI